MLFTRGTSFVSPTPILCGQSHFASIFSVPIASQHFPQAASYVREKAVRSFWGSVRLDPSLLRPLRALTAEEKRSTHFLQIFTPVRPTCPMLLSRSGTCLLLYPLAFHQDTRFERRRPLRLRMSVLICSRHRHPPPPPPLPIHPPLVKRV